jgi:hypothetical protein
MRFPREEISQARLNTIRGIENLDRLDESLYQDFETDDMRKVTPFRCSSASFAAM